MKLWVIDAMAIAHWLYHADEERPLAESVDGWCREFIAKCKPEQAVACFDGRGNWRHAVSSEYKIARKAKPKDEKKIAAINTAREAFEKYFVCVSEDGFEADDVVATLACWSPTGAVIVSSDKDLMQLVGGDVLQYDPRPARDGECKLYDADGVEKKLGVPPHRVLDLLSIKGDASDSIPGVAGWGEVLTIVAIKQTHSFAELKRKALAGELKDIHQNRQKRLREDDKVVPFSEQLEGLEASRKLATLRVDVPIQTTNFALKGVA